MKKYFKNKQKEQPLKKNNFFSEIQVEFLIHELKDPISVIETGLRTLLERKEKYGSLSPRQEKTLKRSLRNTIKAREMLYSLLEIGRSEADCLVCCHFEPVKTTYYVLMTALEIMADNIYEQCIDCEEESKALNILSDNGIFFNIDPMLDNMEMFQDETKFCYIIGNLIKNALHYKKNRLKIDMKLKENHLLMDIMDDGPGINPEHHELIFKLYARSEQKTCSAIHRKGHGLGLAGSLILARSLGGDIKLKRKKGKGACFRLMVPVKFIGDDSLSEPLL